MLVFVSSLSYAENWTYVGIDNEGTSYYVNSSSIKVNESYGGNSVTNISAEIKLDTSVLLYIVLLILLNNSIHC